MRRLTQRLATPAGVHVAALVVGFAVLLVVAREQWFFGDDWAILVPRSDGELLSPHVGHWNLVPALLFPLLRDAVGLGSYLPFLIPAVLVHLAVAHLTWRILLRVGVAPWIATALSVIVIVLGGGAENILWAFQFGFMGAIALGLSAVLLLDRERLPIVPLLIVTIVAPMFSGTAIPVLAAAAIVGWVRHGFRRTVAIMLPTAVIYVTWYVLAGASAGGGTGFSGWGDLPAAALFAAAMVAGGLGRGLPWIGLGAAVAVAVAVWFAVTVRKGIRSPAAAAYALVIGAIVFVLLTTYSRLAFGISAAASMRYAYLTIVLLLPAIGIMLTALAARSRVWAWVVAAVLAIVAVTNLVLLSLYAAEQAAREAESRAAISSALEALRENPADETLLSTPADAVWAPDLLGSDLLELDRRGQVALSNW